MKSSIYQENTKFYKVSDSRINVKHKDNRSVKLSFYRQHLDSLIDGILDNHEFIPGPLLKQVEHYIN